MALRRLRHLKRHLVPTPYLDQRRITFHGNLNTENACFIEIIKDSPVIVGDNS